MKAFNTTGLCRPGKHYMLDPLARLPEARELIEQGKYFVVHAPRQTGKTTLLAALAARLNDTGRYAAFYVTCEAGKVAQDDYGKAERLVLAAIRESTRHEKRLPPDCLPPDPWPEGEPGFRLLTCLSEWAERCPRPLVLLLDEIDALRGGSLISVLTQLRAGFNSPQAPFPHSVVLCGLRDVRDYKAASGGAPDRLGTSSPFNISVASLRVGDFSFAEVAELYGQHTAATGQEFTDYALQRAFEASQGQPWLVNALARDIVEEMRVPADRPVTDSLMEQAVERLILQRATHLDSLVARLYEDPVRRIMEPMIAGNDRPRDAVYSDDLSYVRDLGLVTLSGPVQVANPIYQEVVVRVLTEQLQDQMPDVRPQAFLLPDGRLDIPKVIEDFVAFWRANGEIMDSDRTYHEAACHLAFMAFLQRVVNGGASVDREYALGLKRVDLVIRKPYTDGHGQRAIQWSAFELKVRTDRSGDPTGDGLEQLDAYLDRLGLDTGTLIVFDRRRDAPSVAERIRLEEGTTPKGRAVTVLNA